MNKNDHITCRTRPYCLHGFYHANADKQPDTRKVPERYAAADTGLSADQSVSDHSNERAGREFSSNFGSVACLLWDAWLGCSGIFGFWAAVAGRMERASVLYPCDYGWRGAEPCAVRAVWLFALRCKQTAAYAAYSAYGIASVAVR